MSAATRRRALSALAVIAVIAGVTLFNRLVVRSGPAADMVLVLSASIAIGIVAAIAAEWPKSRTHVVALATAASVASLAATFAHLPREAPQDAFWIVTEALALLTLVVLAARWATVRGAVAGGGMTAIAVMATMWRITDPTSPPDVPALIGALLNWSFGVASAVALGIYLRTLDAKRSRSVAEARRAQRLEIARDLHDFVAHDVTGMVVQAQAAHVVADRDPKEAIAALERIEDAGLRALGSLDHTVKMLGDLAARGQAPDLIAEEWSPAPPSRRFELEDVLALVGRFASTDRRAIRVHVDTSTEPRIPVEVTSIAYRVVLEALTNVRRHAPAGARVEVSIACGERPGGRALTVRVTNEGATPVGSAPPTSLRGNGTFGGRGLAQLMEHVAGLGGSFAAGSIDGSDSPAWHVTAVLPLGRDARS